MNEPIEREVTLTRGLDATLLLDLPREAAVSRRAPS